MCFFLSRFIVASKTKRRLTDLWSQAGVVKEWREKNPWLLLSVIHIAVYVAVGHKLQVNQTRKRAPMQRYGNRNKKHIKLMHSEQRKRIRESTEKNAHENIYDTSTGVKSIILPFELFQFWRHRWHFFPSLPSIDYNLVVRFFFLPWCVFQTSRLTKFRTMVSGIDRESSHCFSLKIKSRHKLHFELFAQS